MKIDPATEVGLAGKGDMLKLGPKEKGTQKKPRHQGPCPQKKCLPCLKKGPKEKTLPTAACQKIHPYFKEKTPRPKGRALRPDTSKLPGKKGPLKPPGSAQSGGKGGGHGCHGEERRIVSAGRAKAHASNKKKRPQGGTTQRENTSLPRSPRGEGG